MKESLPSEPLKNSAGNTPERLKTLPFSRWFPFIAGVASGIILRLIFSGGSDGVYSAMDGSFIYFSPLLVGMVTVYFAERKRRCDWRYYIWAPMLANCFYIIGTFLIMIEGMICALLISPLFMILGALGGLLMGAICRVTKWPRASLSVFALLPLAMGALEPQLGLPEKIGTLDRVIEIHAAPSEVWPHIETARDIQPHEVGEAWMYRIGVPLPISGETVIEDGRPIRKVKMNRDVHFDQVAVDWQPDERVHWIYRFYSDSFPAGALDDHVLIGGHYFDLLDTTYTLTPVGDKTQLAIHMRYRVSTRFNWYADPIAQWLIGNFSEVILEFYRERSEAALGLSGVEASP